MPTCQNCGKKWSWKQTFIRLVRFRTAMACPYCGEEQYESASSRRKTMLIGMMPIPLVFILPYISGLTIWMALILVIVISAGMISVMPFFLKLSNELEPYW
ncbi:TIGR04104 family putative zinc finger protein [Lentibacillus salinarum]|uniref:TIGR04104 family putative zinc finger protein n=1 Tax=Lentibacillus salinarum TaxID=446820 RepID=A0ABW3ZTT3_9BACI